MNKKLKKTLKIHSFLYSNRLSGVSCLIASVVPFSSFLRMRIHVHDDYGGLKCFFPLLLPWVSDYRKRIWRIELPPCLSLPLFHGSLFHKKLCRGGGYHFLYPILKKNFRIWNMLRMSNSKRLCFLMLLNIWTLCHVWHEKEDSKTSTV